MKYQILCPIFVILGLFSRGLPASTYFARIVSSTGSQLLVDLVPDWKVDTLRVVGGQKYLFSFPGAVFPSIQDSLQVPVCTFSVGVPPDGLTFCDIVESDFQLIGACELVSAMSDKDEPAPAPSVFDFVPGTWGPSVTPIVGDAYRFRDQRMVQITIPALQLNSATREVKRYNRLRLRIRFEGAGRITDQFRWNAAEESLYRSIILNYEQSRKWRLRIPPQALKPLPKANISGSFFTFRITREGMYRLDGSTIQSHARLEDIDPTKIRLFNNGGGELPRALNEPRPEGLVENAILVEDGGDGRFDAEDYIVFYGRGTTDWTYDPQANRFEHLLNRYETENVYWLNFGGDVDGKRMLAPPTVDVVAPPLETYTGLAYFEDEAFNPLNSGMNWFSRKLDSGFNETLVRLSLVNPVPSGESILRTRFVAVSADTHYFEVRFNQQTIGEAALVGRPYTGQLSDYIKLNLKRFEFPLDVELAPQNDILIRHSHKRNIAVAFLDWVELQYTARTQLTEGRLLMNVLPENEQQSYRVFGADENSRVFDVSQFDDVRVMITNDVLSDGIVFSASKTPAALANFAVVSPDGYDAVPDIEPASFVDLRASPGGAEFLIITHDDFLSEAARLQQHRENGAQRNRLSTELVRVSDIYNNFSGGMVDPVAIRDFIRYAYDNWNPRPSYVLLFGDGSYDFKQRLVHEQTNWIPTFQTDGEREDGVIGQLESRAMDAWFTYLSTERRMWLAIGRLPVRSLEEAKAVVDKIVEYENHPVFEPWRQTISFVADDEFVRGHADPGEMRHVRQSERIANSLPIRYDIRKIFMPEYPKEVGASSGGIVRPSGREAILEQLNQGTVMMNYMGHGNPDLWAHEYIFVKSDDQNIRNAGKLPLFVAATCDWGLYDDPFGHRQAEELLVTEERGCIGIFGSSRDVYADQNERINGEFYGNLFNSDGSSNRIGQAFLASFGQVPDDDRSLTNDEKFHILGDPTLLPAFPEALATIDHLSPDSIVALAKTQVSGAILRDGEPWSDFSGKALVNVFDSKKSVERSSGVEGYFFQYELPGNSIYRGVVPVEAGVFNATFIVPKDLSYGGSKARVSVYFWNDETDGNGILDGIRVSNRSDTTLRDVEGPELRLFFEGLEDFVTGDIIPDDVTLVAELADQGSGINIAGDIGHRITLQLAPEDETCSADLTGIERMIDLTNYFVFDEGEYLRGKVRYPLQFPQTIERNGQTISCSGLDGMEKHNLTLKAWDNANNSTTLRITVNVSHEQGLAIHDLLNYPNPFADETSFTFMLTEDAAVQLKIYSVAGRLIRILEFPFGARGFNVIPWDGRDGNGDALANGVYLYKIIARSQSPDAGRVENIGRLAILR